MSQNDFNLANADGATFRADNNSALQALATMSSGTAAPTTTYAGQIWWDTTNNLVKRRNGANTAWITVAAFDGATWTPYRNGTVLGDASVETIGTSGAVVPKLNGANIWSAAQRGAVVTLTDGASITPDLSAGNNFTVTLGGNRTLENPSNQVAGQSGIIMVIQDATGSRTLAYGTNWKFENGTAPVLSTAASAIDMLAYYVKANGEIHASLTKAWA